LRKNLFISLFGNEFPLAFTLNLDLDQQCFSHSSKTAMTYNKTQNFQEFGLEEFVIGHTAVGLRFSLFIAL
jgi:hypothetical protein